MPYTEYSTCTTELKIRLLDSCPGLVGNLALSGLTKISVVVMFVRIFGGIPMYM